MNAGETACPESVHLVRCFQWTILSNHSNSIQTLFKERHTVTYVRTFDMPSNSSFIVSLENWRVQFNLSFLTGNPSGITLNFSMDLHELVTSPQTLFFFRYEFFFSCARDRPFSRVNPLYLDFLFSNPLRLTLLLAISTNSRQKKGSVCSLYKNMLHYKEQLAVYQL